MEDESCTGLTCGCQLLFLLVVVILGGIASDYLIEEFFHTNIPFIWDELIGIVAGGIIIPVTLVVLILKYLGVI